MHHLVLDRPRSTGLPFSVASIDGLPYSVARPALDAVDGDEAGTGVGHEDELAVLPAGRQAGADEPVEDADEHHDHGEGDRGDDRAQR